MSMAGLRWARSVRGITGTQKFVLVMLSDMANDYGEAWPTAISLAADCCLSERAVRDAFDALEAAGLLVGDRQHGRATRWCIQIGREPARDAAPPARDTTPPERRSALPARRESASTTPERGAPTPEPGSDPPRNVAQNGRNHVPTEPSRTPIQPSRTPNARAKPLAVAVTLPAWLPPDAWDAWCQHRVARDRKGWTHAAAVRCISTLEKFRDQGDDPSAVIDQSIAGGWTGLFPLKRRGGAAGAAQNQSKLAWMLEPQP